MNGGVLVVSDDEDTARLAEQLRSAVGAAQIALLHLGAGPDPGPPAGRGDHPVALAGEAPDEPLTQAISAMAPSLDHGAPSLLVTLGDSTASLGAALSAAARGVPVVRLGAGRRTYRRSGLAGETSRVLQDHLAAVCVAADEPARRILLREGMSPDRAWPAEGVPGETVSRLAASSPAVPRWHPLGESPPAAEPNGLTFDAYRRLMESFSDAGYTPSFFPDAMAAGGGPYLLLRHDVDMRLEDAARLAELEVELGVRSTYFFLLRTDFYNVLSASGTELVTGILGHGHRLGLHLDLASYGDPEDPETIREASRREAKLLGDWLGYPVDAVSFHRPPPSALTSEGSVTGPFPHTALPRFTQEMKYLSESRGRWREGPPDQHEAFQARRSIQLLTHPLWWCGPPAAPLDRLLELADRMRESLELSMARNNQVYRVGWLAEQVGNCR